MTATSQVMDALLRQRYHEHQCAVGHRLQDDAAIATRGAARSCGLTAPAASSHGQQGRDGISAPFALLETSTGMRRGRGVGITSFSVAVIRSKRPCCFLLLSNPSIHPRSSRSKADLDNTSCFGALEHGEERRVANDHPAQCCSSGTGTARWTRLLLGPGAQSAEEQALQARVRIWVIHVLMFSMTVSRRPTRRTRRRSAHAGAAAGAASSRA